MSALLEREVERMTKSKFEFFSSEKDNAGWNMHLHPAVEILYFICGEHRITVDDMTFMAKPGDLILIRSNAAHALSKDPDVKTQHYALKLHSDLLFSSFMDVPHAYVMQFFGASTCENTYFPAERVPKEIREQYARMIGMLGDATGIGQVEKLAKRDELLYATLRNEAIRLVLLMFRHLFALTKEEMSQPIDQHSVRRMLDGVNYIEENYANPITPLDCAAHLCMSYSHFAKQFRAVTGRTFKQYLTYVRITRAETDLLTTNDSVTEVALRAGFNNVSHFIATYRSLRGKTPLETRRERGMRGRDRSEE